MNNAKLRLMGLLLTNSVFCLTAAMGMEQKSERKFVWTTIGRYVNAETNNKPITPTRSGSLNMNRSKRIDVTFLPVKQV